MDQTIGGNSPRVHGGFTERWLPPQLSWTRRFSVESWQISVFFWIWDKGGSGKIRRQNGTPERIFLRVKRPIFFLDSIGSLAFDMQIPPEKVVQIPSQQVIFGCLQLELSSTCIRWAPTNCKWSYFTPIKWPY